MTRPNSSNARAHAALLQCVQRVLSSQPLTRTSERTLSVLSEVVERYLCLLARTAADNAMQANRAQPSIWDVLGALESLGTRTEELGEWLEDGMALGGDAEERDEGLAAQLQHGRPAPSAPIAELHYVSVPKEDLEDLEQLRTLTEEPWLEPLESDLVSQAGDASDAEDSTSSLGTPPREAPLANGHKRQRLSGDATLPDYVPRFLPSFPPAETNGVDAAEVAYIQEQDWLAQDAEYARFEAARRAEEDAREQAKLEAERAAMVEGEPGAASPTAEAVRAVSPVAADPEMEVPTLDVWRKGVRYVRSTLASQQSSLDVPSLPMGRHREAPTPHSSLRAFSNDYRALLAERTAPALLTPIGAANASAAAARRALALAISDGAKFLPGDSVFGATSVRPTTLPFQPSASHFVTSNGKFIPTKPLGRPISLLPPSASLAPTLSHRWPSHTAVAARAVAGPGLFRKISRLADPEPVYDAGGVERVFQGAPTSGELLSSNNSILAPSMRFLANESMPRVDTLDAAAVPAYQAFDRPSDGMLVHTWEWTTREYAEPALPGKRVRGTNEAEGSGRS